MSFAFPEGVPGMHPLVNLGVREAVDLSLKYFFNWTGNVGSLKFSISVSMFDLLLLYS